MGEIRLFIPDDLHKRLKWLAAVETLRLPEFITRVLEEYANSKRADAKPPLDAVSPSINRENLGKASV